MVKIQHKDPIHKAERTKHRFVSAIRTELATSGQFSADTVAKRARTSPATFYNHFSSKESALASAFEAAMDELITLVDAGLRIELLLQQGLPAFCAGWVQVCAEFFNNNAELLALVHAEAPASKVLREIFLSRQQDSLCFYEQFIELGQRAQMIRLGDAQAMARMLMITNQSWNHPFLRQAKPGDPLYQEMTQVMIQLLAPSTISD